MVMNDAVINNAGDDTALARVWIIHTKVRNFHLVSSSFLPHRNRMTRCVGVLFLITFDGNILSFLEKIVSAGHCLKMNRQLQSGVWVASYLSMSPFPLIGRVVHRQKHLTVEREKWDVTFVFTPEMWSLTRLSKPNTSLDLNKTLGSWSSSSPQVIWVVSVSGVWWWWVVRRCHVVITSAIKLNWVTIQRHTFSDEDVTS